MKKGIAVVIIALFIVSAVSPMVIGFESYVIESDVDREELLENLAFYCYGPDGLDTAKYEILKEQLLKDYSNDEIDNEVDEIHSIEPLQSISSNGPMDSPWPMQSHDNVHTGRSPYSTADVDGLEKWRFRADDWVNAGMSIDNNGIIYFGDFDRYIYALYPNGTEKWRYGKTGGWIESAPALSEEGTIYVGSWDAKLYAIHPNGTLKWKTSAGGSITSSPAIAQDGTIYVGTMSSSNSIVAFNPNGTRKWMYETGDLITSDPTIGDDGTIYCGSGDYYFYALYPNGILKWRYKTGDYVQGPASIDDGTVYVGSHDGYLYALYSNNGTMKWKCKVGQGTKTNPSIAEDGTIYVGGAELYAIYPNGTMKWSFNLEGENWIGGSSPAISSDGTIYIGTHNGDGGGGYIIAVNTDGTEKWRKKIANFICDSSPSIGEDGTVYIGSASEWGGYLHAFGPVESNSPPEPPTISGETNGQSGKEYWYTFRINDPDNNPVSTFIDFGDGGGSWKHEHASGEKFYYPHSWNEQGEYTIRAKARDTLGEESNWTYLEVTMPKNQQVSNMWFLRWLERFPNAFPIFRHLLII